MSWIDWLALGATGLYFGFKAKEKVDKIKAFDKAFAEFIDRMSKETRDIIDLRFFIHKKSLMENYTKEDECYVDFLKSYFIFFYENYYVIKESHKGIMSNEYIIENVQNIVNVMLNLGCVKRETYDLFCLIEKFYISK
ncbi:hypothetical protein SHELI_v1c09810 [Spiroplasma helicoides]|uniref:Uncharacterized protein n=1 Tax=Spiroplasma helicoides TaxID=216938 RepID=A0A1B3SLX1_9MOLU|nr:hypothetical protein [Spiroplasma helicoides]AOG60928.1 hypothetical protein SHELI_v1c09810 [Spiroplasma helicoides]